MSFPNEQLISKKASLQPEAETFLRGGWMIRKTQTGVFRQGRLASSVENIPDEAETEEDEAFWRSAFEASVDGVCIWYLTENKVFFSKHWKEMLGLDHFELTSAFDEWGKRVHPDDLNLLCLDLSACLRGEKSVFCNKHRLLCSDQTWKCVLCRGQLTDMAPGETSERIVCAFTDISVLEKTVNDLVESLRKEKELNALKTKVVSMTSHEFRTPLSAILIAADAIEAYFDRMTKTEIRKKLRLIRNNVGFLRMVLEKILIISHLESGKIEFCPVKTEMNGFVTTVIEEVTDREEDREISYLNPGFPVWIHIDPQLMKLALINLLSNALKYSPKGSEVTVSLEVSNSECRIHVTDQGIGIPDQDGGKIFDLSFRGSNVGNIRGAGLGLCLVRKVIRHHGGQVSFVSTLHVGTTFTLTIPVQNDEQKSRPC